MRDNLQNINNKSRERYQDREIEKEILFVKVDLNPKEKNNNISFFN